jgi:hypothetical protein
MRVWAGPLGELSSHCKWTFMTLQHNIMIHSDSPSIASRLEVPVFVAPRAQVHWLEGSRSVYQPQLILLLSALPAFQLLQSSNDHTPGASATEASSSSWQGSPVSAEGLYSSSRRAEDGHPTTRRFQGCNSRSCGCVHTRWASSSISRRSGAVNAKRSAGH